jgi:hypothetical protein
MPHDMLSFPVSDHTDGLPEEYAFLLHTKVSLYITILHDGIIALGICYAH